MPSSDVFNGLIFWITTAGIYFSVWHGRVVWGKNLIVVVMLLFSETWRSGKGIRLLQVWWKVREAPGGCVKASKGKGGVQNKKEIKLTWLVHSG